jgi:FkbM family methyltransferase
MPFSQAKALMMIGIHTQSHSLRRRLRSRLGQFGLMSSVQTDSSRMPRLRNTDVRLLRASTANEHVKVRLGGKPFEVADPVWDLHSYQEILVSEIYRFEAQTDSPLIVDCGANIGFSVVYFKHLYPRARVIAFEPEPTLYGMLQRNIEAMELTGVELHCSAVWIEHTSLEFTPNGSVGGHFTRDSDGGPRQMVSAIRLRELLDQHIDFLKLDIEGAEAVVLRDCADKLGNVDCFFFEYHGLPKEAQVLDDLLRLCRLSGFRYYIKEARNVSHPFLSREREWPYDLQLNIYAFRE